MDIEYPSLEQSTSKSHRSSYTLTYIKNNNFQTKNIEPKQAHDIESVKNVGFIYSKSRFPKKVVCDAIVWDIRGLSNAIRFILTLSLCAEIVDWMRALIGKSSHFDRSVGLNYHINSFGCILCCMSLLLMFHMIHQNACIFWRPSRSVMESYKG